MTLDLNSADSKQDRGTLYIISAPSGAGKTSLVKSILAQEKHLEVSVSYTTREIRAGEVNGLDYHFVSHDDFLVMLEQGKFLEQAEVFGHFYGTAQDCVEKQLAAGTDIILEIDWQGAQQIRRLVADSVSIFILPPNRKTLLERLQKRGRDDENIIDKRMAAAIGEMSHYSESDYLIINDDFKQALGDISAIIKSQRLTIKAQAYQCKKLITELLSEKD